MEPSRGAGHALRRARGESNSRSAPPARRRRRGRKEREPGRFVARSPGSRALLGWARGHAVRVRHSACRPRHRGAGVCRDSHHGRGHAGPGAGKNDEGRAGTRTLAGGVRLTLSSGGGVVHVQAHPRGRGRSDRPEGLRRFPHGPRLPGSPSPAPGRRGSRRPPCCAPIWWCATSSSRKRAASRSASRSSAPRDPGRAGDLHERRVQGLLLGVLRFHRSPGAGLLRQALRPGCHARAHSPAPPA